jgi:hypothetical protein
MLSPFKHPLQVVAPNGDPSQYAGARAEDIVLD